MLLQSGIRSTSSIRLLMVYDHHQKRTSPHVLHSLLQAQSSHLTAYVNGGFPQIRGTLFWGPYNKDPIWGVILGSPIFGNSQMGSLGEPKSVSTLELAACAS